MRSSVELVVFAGPTLWGVDRASFPDVTFRPPASQGDVYLALREAPRAIGIVDGYFERVPAVWHKEILWALSKGVRVYGSASMGALRAAELSEFGMRGVGRVFESFRDGVIEDDAEVAIVHADADGDFRPLSDALVDIRATLEAAATDGVISPAFADRLTNIAVSLFYADRTYARVLADAGRAGLSSSELAALRAWLPTGRVAQKQKDAIEMLQRMGEDLQGEAVDAEPARFRFQHTDAWEQVRSQIDGRAVAVGAVSETFQHDAVLEELRIVPDDYVSVRQDAVIRTMALQLAGAADDVGDVAIADEVEGLRRRLGLETVESMDEWLEAESLTVHEFSGLIVDEARARRVRAVVDGRLHGAVVDVLRLTGRQSRLVARSVAKHELLATHGLENPTLEHAGLSADELWEWYYGTLLGRAVPDDLDAEAARLDYLDVHAMRRAALREYCYRRLLDGDGDVPTAGDDVPGGLT